MAHIRECNHKQGNEEAQFTHGAAAEADGQPLVIGTFRLFFDDEIPVQDDPTQQAYGSQEWAGDLDEGQSLSNHQGVQSLNEELRIVLQDTEHNVLQSFDSVHIILIIWVFNVS